MGSNSSSKPPCDLSRAAILPGRFSFLHRAIPRRDRRGFPVVLPVSSGLTGRMGDRGSRAPHVP